MWKFDKTLYQSNSLAGRVAQVTWGDGLQSLITMPFSFLYNMNDNSVGALNKLGLTLSTPYVDAVFGYGDLGSNGMTDYTGIFHVLQNSGNGKGFTELRLGSKLQRIGDVTLNATAALSMERGTYGLYDLVRVQFGDTAGRPLVDAALTFGSTTDVQELFFYNTSNQNAVSLYAAVSPLQPLTVQAHVLASFATGTAFGIGSFAGALRGAWDGGWWTASVRQTVAGSNAKTVWGDDATVGAGTAVTQADCTFAIADWVTAGADETFTVYNLQGASDYTGDRLSLRNQLFADFALGTLIGFDLDAGVYAVASLDLANKGAAKNGVHVYFDEAGIELTSAAIPGIQSLTFDWAIYGSYGYDSGRNKALSCLYNSFMVSAGITGQLDVNLAAIIRGYTTASETNQPIGLAVGCSYDGVPLPGRPKAYAHCTYGMDPYGSNYYSLYRADAESSHRTYRLYALGSDMTSSYVRLGLIWDL